MGGGHEPFTVPDHRIYDNWKAFPRMVDHEKRLNALGLTDPWKRNHLYLMDEKYTHSHTFERFMWPNKQMRQTLFRGFPACFIVTGVCIAISEGYTYVRYGYTSWNRPHAH